MEINGKVAVVTGGASGMGATTARYLSSKGAKVVVIDRDQAAADTVANEINGLAVQCDVSSAEQAEEAFAKIIKEVGAPRICVNCAGVGPAKRIVGRDGPMPLEEFERAIKINLIGTFNILRLAAAAMTKLDPVGEDEERGVIINTASVAAFEGQIGQAAYSASKGGVCALTLPAARELGSFNIRVMTIAPGLVQTPLLDGLPAEIRESLSKNIPFPRRFADSKEFAMLVESIITNPYLNGEIIRFDGGLRMQAK